LPLPSGDFFPVNGSGGIATGMIGVAGNRQENVRMLPLVQGHEKFSWIA
jgi:hypothetical protein